MLCRFRCCEDRAVGLSRYCTSHGGAGWAWWLSIVAILVAIACCLVWAAVMLIGGEA